MNGYSMANANGFAPDTTFDPSMLNNNATTQYQNGQYQQPRPQTPSSSFPYTPQQVVPSKRPREEGAVNSPQQPPTTLSLSRSQTPQQFSAAQALQPPNAFQHLQHGGSNNATPSPTLSHQQYRPQAQQPGMGMSPPPDGSGRGTPNQPQFNMNGQMPNQMGGVSGPMGAQMPGQNFTMPGTSMAQGYNQQFAGAAGGMPNMGGAQGSYSTVQLPPHLAQRQAAIQQQMRQQVMAQRQQASMNPAMMQQAALQQQQQRQQQQQAAMGTPTRQPGMPNMSNPRNALEERTFMEKVAKYMQHVQRPFEAHPHIAGRPINLFALFTVVIRAGASKRVASTNNWGTIAKQFGLPPEQFPTAGHELQQLFERNLGPWEAAFHNQQQQLQMARIKAAQQGQMPGMAPGQQHMSPNRPMVPGSQGTPVNQQYVNSLQQQRLMGMQTPQGQVQAQGQMTPQQAHASLPSANGWSTPQPDAASSKASSVIDQHRKSMSRQLDGSPAQLRDGTFATPPPSKSAMRPDMREVNGAGVSRRNTDSTNYIPHAWYLSDPPVTKDKPKPHPRVSHGGFLVETLSGLLQAQASHDFDIPGRQDVGLLDIQVLTLCLQSGIARETRYALDMLVKLTDSRHMVAYVELAACEDLVDVLVDCGEDQVEILSDESKRMEGLEHESYEEIARLARLETNEVQDVPGVGTSKYHKARAAERLLAVTAILRNLSFPRILIDTRRDNSHILAESRAIKFLSKTIGLLSRRVISLQSTNIQDFMKDAIIFLSNTAQHIALESQDDAYNFLQFILAFAPGPIPTETNPFRFASYNPSIHKYYPPAIDVFAKLLARDDPNRTFFRQIFVDVADHEDTMDSDLPVHQQYDLLTRAFAMAIAAIPDVSGYERKPLSRMDDEILVIARARKPTLSQGMLTADILSMLIPASDPGLAKAWLKSQDGWGCVLFRVISELAESDGAREVAFKNQAGGLPAHLHRDPGFQEQSFTSIVSRSMSMLKRLAKKAIEDSSVQPVRPKTQDGEHDDNKVNGIDSTSMDKDETPGPASDENLLDDLADMEKSTATDFLPLSDSIFYGIFANTKELTSGVIADYIALGEILH